MPSIRFRKIAQNITYLQLLLIMFLFIDLCRCRFRHVPEEFDHNWSQFPHPSVHTSYDMIATYFFVLVYSKFLFIFPASLCRHAQFLPHRDSGAGSGQSGSLLVSLGDFGGGELVLDTRAVDARYSPVLFDGWSMRHWWGRREAGRERLLSGSVCLCVGAWV